MTLPNILTLSRILLIPLILYTFYYPSVMTSWIAAIAFMFACITDFLDGYVARAWKQTSKFGQVFDPIADKLLIASVLLMLAGFGHLKHLALIPAVIILCREILISGMREHVMHQILPVTYLSKVKTTTQMAALTLLLLGPLAGEQCVSLGNILLWIAASLSVKTGYAYVKKTLLSMEEHS